MPVPIKLIRDEKIENNNSIDYSFLVSQPTPKKVFASNKDASLLFELWSKGEKIDSETYKIGSSVESKDFMRLKSLGFVTGNLSGLQFTNKGKMVITTMSLGESNQFADKRSNKSYTEILASMDKRGKKGFRTASVDPKFSTNNSNSLDLSKLWKSTQN